MSDRPSDGAEQVNGDEVSDQEDALTKPDSRSEEAAQDGWTWRDVEMIIEDLKRDGYQPTELKTNTSESRPQKSILLRVERDSNE